MKIACDEDPEDTQIAFWYARELMYHGDYTEALGQLPGLHHDGRRLGGREDAGVPAPGRDLRACSARSVMERRAIEDAIAIAPWRREPLLAMARYYSRHTKPAFIPDEAQYATPGAVDPPHHAPAGLPERREHLER